MALEHGYVQVYTGDGKGKTTAALGLALRASGAGRRVFVAQFVKGRPVSELTALATLGPGVRAEQFGLPHFIRGQPGPEDIAAARRGLAAVRRELGQGGWDVVILDEANVAVHLGLFSVEELLEVIEAGVGRVEIVITGRDAHRKLIERADLVTEMREVKHYHSRGVQARKGIED